MGGEPVEHAGEGAVGEVGHHVARHHDAGELLLGAQVERGEVGDEEPGLQVLAGQRDQVWVGVDADRGVPQPGQLARHPPEAAAGIEHP